MTYNQTSLTAFASKFINHTNRHIFLTGKAGTGKTTFLKHIVQHTHKKVIVAAPTGIAAINAGGVTLHSLFQLPFGYFIPDDKSTNYFNENQQVNTPASLLKNAKLNKNKIKLIRELELLIIDEVSMLRADLLDAIDTMLRSIKRRRNVPFGGVQLLLIGDLMQLPPVIKDFEWNVLKNYYSSIYFFNAQAFNNSPPIQIELDKIYRQADTKFIGLLNNLRDNKVTPEDIKILKAHFQPNFKPNPDEGFIRLTTHNKQADTLNREELDKIKSASYYFQAEVEGDFSPYNYPIDESLELKKGAQVMFIKNDSSGRQQFFNGKIGLITSINDDFIEVKTSDEDLIIVEKYTWENVKYQLNASNNEIEGNIVGKFIQYPLKLAWAITVHKSQGLTFDKAIIDIGNAFAQGQVYVALSRLRSLDGLVMTSNLNTDSLSIDQHIAQFCQSKPDTKDIENILKTEEKYFFLNYLVNSYDLSDLLYQIKAHAESYTKAENLSAKQSYLEWAKILQNKVEEIISPTESFKRQLKKIISENNDHQYLFERINAANDYFIPLLKKQSEFIFEHIKHLKNKTKVKKYITELKELEAYFFKQIQQLQKAKTLVESAINNQEFDKSKLTFKEEAEKRTEKLKKVEKKAPKVDTKKVSFDLYKAGKNVKEIAKERGFVEGTIIGHLAHYVGEGEIDIATLLPKKTIDAITKVYKKNKEISGLNELKSQLDNSISYNDIKMVLAALARKG